MGRFPSDEYWESRIDELVGSVSLFIPDPSNLSQREV